MIAEGEIRDANTLSSFARMTALGSDLRPCDSRASSSFARGRKIPEAVKPFLDHLEDLRWTLAKIAMTLGAGMAVAFLFRGTLVEIIQRPLQQVDPHAVSRPAGLERDRSAHDRVRAFVLRGHRDHFPIPLYFLAEFILPALERERAQDHPSGHRAFRGAFASGVCFCYFSILPKTLGFFFGFAKSLEWTPHVQVRDYFSFVTQITLAFGAAFELPVLVLLLVFLRVLTSASCGAPGPLPSSSSSAWPSWSPPRRIS